MSQISPEAAIVLIRRHDEACVHLVHKRNRTETGYAALKQSCINLFAAIVGRRPTTEELKGMVE